MASDHLLRLLHRAHWGFVLTIAYGACSAAALWFLDRGHVDDFVSSFAISFNCIASGGLVFGTFLFVHATRESVPRIIEATFSQATLERTSYPRFARRYRSALGMSVNCASYLIVGFVIFYFCQFPLVGLGEDLMIAFACLQYAALVYVGRRIYFIAHMLNALSAIRLRKSILSNTEIGKIVGYVNIVSAMTIFSIYLNARSYYLGPFDYHSILGLSPRLLLLILVVAGTPVIVVFNFYPRVVLRSLYEQSVEREVRSLKKRLADAQLTQAELETVMIDYDRLKQAEVKERLQITLSDIPILVTVAVALFGIIAKV